jgi:hypothetical protein
VTASRINCQLNINLKYPSGFQYSVLGTDFRGYTYLDAGVTGVQSANYYFSGCTCLFSRLVFCRAAANYCVAA